MMQQPPNPYPQFQQPSPQQWQPQPDYTQPQSYYPPPPTPPQQQQAQQNKPPQPPTKAPTRRSSPRPAWQWILVGLIVGIFIGYAVHVPSSQSSTDSTTATTQGTPQATSQPTQIPTPTHTPKWTTVQTITGNGSKKTAIFTVPDDWKIVWSCNPSSFGGSYNVQLDVVNADGSMFDPAAINTLCQTGNVSGETEEHQSGQVYFDINSEAAWTIQVQELK